MKGKEQKGVVRDEAEFTVRGIFRCETKNGTAYFVWDRNLAMRHEFEFVLIYSSALIGQYESSMRFPLGRFRLASIMQPACVSFRHKRSFIPLPNPRDSSLFKSSFAKSSKV